MYEIIALETGYGFRCGEQIQEFYPFRGGFQPMTQVEAEQIAACFDSPAGPHWTGHEVVPRLVLTMDKPQVVADGADKATVTAAIADPSNIDPVIFTVEDTEPVQVAPTDGVAALEVTFGAGNEGRKTVVAMHPRFGRNEVALEVVCGE